MPYNDILQLFSNISNITYTRKYLFRALRIILVWPDWILSNTVANSQIVFQHILYKNPIPLPGILYKDMGHCSDNFSILQDRGTGHPLEHSSGFFHSSSSVILKHDFPIFFILLIVHLRNIDRYSFSQFHPPNLRSPPLPFLCPAYVLLSPALLP